MKPIILLVIVALLVEVVSCVVTQWQTVHNPPRPVIVASPTPESSVF